MQTLQEGSTLSAPANESGYFILNQTEAKAHFGIDAQVCSRRIVGAFVVENIQAVGRIVELANRNGFKLWPIAGDVDFGYDCSLPVEQDNYIVDLRNLKSIVFNRKTRSVTIEPGVTVQDLADYLSEHDLPYLVPTASLGSKGSLLGNALNGRYGLTPISHHFDAISEFEGVFGNGQWFSHQYRQLGCDDMAQSWSVGTGAGYQSLLRQGNVAVICRATVRLMRKPQASRVIVVEWPSELAFIKHQDTLSQIMEQIPAMGGIVSMNAERILATQKDAPLNCKLQGDARQLYLTRLAKERQIAPWTSVGTLSGTSFSVKGAVKDIKKLLPWVRVWAFSAGGIKRLKQFSQFLPKSGFSAIHRQINLLKEAIDMVAGPPLMACSQLDQATEPAKDDQGILWYAPLVNINSASVLDYVDQLGVILHQYGFDNLLSLTAKTARVHCATIPLLFNKSDETAAARAKACYRALVRKGLEFGMPPHRIGVEYMDELHISLPNNHNEVMASVSAHFDPNNTIAPLGYSK